MNLHELKAPATSKKSRKRVGRGQGSGRGEQSGRGHNGQKSRSGSKLRAWFEGGQMPLQRRIPKFGFTNRFRKEYQALNVATIEEFIGAGRLKETITIQDLNREGLVDDQQLIKILGEGEITSKVTIEAHGFSSSAKKKIEAAGGTIVEIQ